MRPIRSAAAAVLSAIMLMSAHAWAQTAPREERIKAALIFKLVKFVEWPSALLSGSTPLQLCAYGNSGVTEALAAADGKPARDRTAKFHKLDSLSANDIKGCHVLFIAAGTREIANGVPPVLRNRGSGLLTVSDHPDFARRGGMIGLNQGENKITFEINLRLARDSGLEPGASLLELATVVD